MYVYWFMWILKNSDAHLVGCSNDLSVAISNFTRIHTYFCKKKIPLKTFNIHIDTEHI